MSFNVPNLPDADSIDLAEPDAGDFRALGDHTTGVLSGGAITASDPASMLINAAAVSYLINNEYYSSAASNVTLNPSGAGLPRFDLVGWNAAGQFTFIMGTASSNPQYPLFDPKTFCLAAAVFVGDGATALPQPVIVEKQISLETKMVRRYDNATDVGIQLDTASVPSALQVLADGTIKWRTSYLKQTSSTSLELSTKLVTKQAAIEDTPHITKLASGVADATKVYVVEDPASSAERLSIDAAGRMFADNFRQGNGSPEGVVSARRGTLYVDLTAATAHTSLWLKMTPSGTTGWVSFRSYSASESALPTGTLIAWVGRSTDTIPTGYSLANGSAAVINANTQALYDLVGTSFGTAPAGLFIPAPDLRGRTLIGAGNVAALLPGATVGSASVTITTAQMPSHNHPVTDPGHRHPRSERPWFYRPISYPTGYSVRRWIGDTGYSMAIDEVDTLGKTNVSIGNTGSSQPVPMYQPSTAATYLVKW